MNTNEPAFTPQRTHRDMKMPPGFWKRQLPGKIRAIACRGDVEGLRNLLKQHPELLNQRGSHGRTLLWEATRKGKLEAVRWLIEQGAELDAMGCYNGESLVQLTPYCAAVYYRRKEVAAFLLAKGARLDIFRAAFMGDRDRVAHELAAHAEMLNAEDPQDNTYFFPLLAFPIVGGQIEMLNFLLERGAVVPPYSSHLILLAARHSRLDMIERLVAFNADVRAVTANIFVEASEVSMIQYLLSHGASPSMVMENGFTPLTYLARGDKGEHPEKIRLMLEHGAAVNARGPKGRTALHYAAAGGFLRVMTLLLEHGADAGLKDDEGETALSLAQRNGKAEAVTLLSHRTQ